MDGLAYLFSGELGGVGEDPTAKLECGWWTGSEVAAAGDVDGDGLDDVLTDSADNGVCLFLGSTLAGPGETGVIETGDPSPPHPDPSPGTGTDDSPAGTDSDDTEQPARPGKAGCAGGGCGGGSVSAVGVLVGLSGIRRRRTSTTEQRRKRRSAAGS